MRSAHEKTIMRYSGLLIMLLLLIGCIHKPPTPDLPRGAMIEYGKPGVVR